MAEYTHEESAAIFRAFSDNHRIHILELLTDGEKCAAELLKHVPVSQPTLSHHMKVLCDSGIVISRKNGKWTHYSISPEGVERAREEFNRLTVAPPLPKRPALYRYRCMTYDD